MWRNKYRFNLKKKVLVLGDSTTRNANFVDRNATNSLRGSSAYAEALGVAVAVRREAFTMPTEDVNWGLTLTLFDILGEKTIRGRLLDAYAQGTAGILAVCDPSGPETLSRLTRRLESVYELGGRLPTVVVLTNLHRGKTGRFTVDDARALASSYRAPFFDATEERRHGDEAFHELGADLVQRAFGVRPTVRGGK